MDAADWDARYEAAELVWSAGPNQFVAAEVADVPPGRALDLAAGEGRNAIWLAERGWEVEAVDFSRVALDKGARIATERGVRLSWTVGDVLAPGELAAADLVLVAYLQLPRSDMRTALRHAADLVRPGGMLLVVGHAPRNLDEGHGGPSQREVLSGPQDIVTDLIGTGVVVERAEEVLRQVDTPEGPRQAIDVLVRGRRPPAA